MSHDLMINFIKAAGYDIEKIEINDVDNETYFSTVSPEVIDYWERYVY